MNASFRSILLLWIGHIRSSYSCVAGICNQRYGIARWRTNTTTLVINLPATVARQSMFRRCVSFTAEPVETSCVSSPDRYMIHIDGIYSGLQEVKIVDYFGEGNNSGEQSHSSTMTYFIQNTSKIDDSDILDAIVDIESPLYGAVICSRQLAVQFNILTFADNYYNGGEGAKYTSNFNYPDSFSSTASPASNEANSLLDVSNGEQQMQKERAWWPSYNFIEFEAEGILKQQFAGDVTYIYHSLEERDIGTWFLTIEARSGTTGTEDGNEGLRKVGSDAYDTSANGKMKRTMYPNIRSHTAHGYIEFVLTCAEIQQRRNLLQQSRAVQSEPDSLLHDTPHRAANSVRTTNGRYEAAELTAKSNDHSLTNSTSDAGIPPKTKAVPSNICIFSGSTLDGQKQIWLQQTRHLSTAMMSSSSTKSSFDTLQLPPQVQTQGQRNSKLEHVSGSSSEGSPKTGTGAGQAEGRGESPAGSFHLVWLLDEGAPANDPLRNILEQLRIQLNEQTNMRNDNDINTKFSGRRSFTIGNNPNFRVKLDELQQRPSSESINITHSFEYASSSYAYRYGPSTAAADIWAGDSLNLFRYAHERFIRANYNIDHIQPAWCKRFYSLVREELVKHACDVVVYGNMPGYSADVIIVDTARVMGIPLVAELNNVHMDAEVRPDVIVAPSTYAALHDSVQTALQQPLPIYHSYQPQRRPSSPSSTTSTITNSRNSEHATFPRAVVIPPSVDTTVFDPGVYSHSRGERSTYRHPACIVAADGDTSTGSGHNGPCMVIGFLARLSPEKSPGLFLQAAYEILQLYPFARFTVIGDGMLRSSLEELASRLYLRDVVHFVGWVKEAELPQMLAGIDIVINLSLRASDETFCIANIEVMSMSIPLVTFAVGGIGEYVSAPAEKHSADTNGSIPDYTVSSNAVIVNRATPMAIAHAVHYLITHPTEREVIGTTGRQTVVSYFHLDRQMQQYAYLYTSLV